MVLFTRIEVKKTKVQDESTQEYDELTRRVLSEAGIDNTNDEEDAEYFDTSAILDLDQDLLFWKLDEYTMVERLNPGSQVRIKHEFDQIVETYLESLSEEELEEIFEDDELPTEEEIAQVEKKAYDDLKAHFEEVRGQIAKSKD